MKRTILLALSIICVLYSLSFSTGLHAQPDSSHWEKFESFPPPLELEFIEDPEIGKKTRYIQWPLWKPNAAKILASEYLVSLKEVKNRLQEAGIEETVTIEIGIKSSRQHFPGGSRVAPSQMASRYIQVIAQLGTFKPEIVQKDDKREVVFPIPEPNIAYAAHRVLLETKKYRDVHDIPLGIPLACLLVLRNMDKEVKAQVKINCYFALEQMRREFRQIEFLIVKGKYKAAETYCETVKPGLKEKAFGMVGKAYFKNGDLDAAARCFEKSGKDQKTEAFNNIGCVHLARKNYETAAEYLDKGELAGIRAQAYGKLGDYYRDESNTPKAKEFYQKAISDYESMIKSIHFAWKDFDNKDRRRCIAERYRLKDNQAEIARRHKLKKLLDGSQKYCRKLFGATFDFICHEQVTERIENATEGRFKYFYRLTKKGKDVKEERSLLKKRGRRFVRRIQSANSESYTTERVIFGPNAMVGEGWDLYFDYRIIGEETLDGHKTVIVDVIPKRKNTRNPFFGQVWINEKDYSVMKISWNPKSIEGLQQNFQTRVLERAKLYKGEPHILSILELNVEKRGLRFPSRLLIEESYIKPNGRKVVRVKRTTDYVDYLFYSVGADVTDEVVD